MGSLKSKVFLFLKNHKKQIVFYLFLNLAFTFCITLSSYVHIPLSGFKDRLLYIAHIIILQFSVSGYIYLATLSKWLFRIVFIPCFFCLSLFAYWTYTQDISITHALVEILIETKPSIAIDMISIQFSTFSLFIIGLLFYLDRIYKKLRPVKVNFLFLILVLLSILSFIIVENRRGHTLKSRLPYSVVFGIQDYLHKEAYVFENNFDGIESKIDSLKIVLVLGETVRADHLQLNGYQRETTPLLNKRKNLISFNNVYTPHTYTSASLPRLITDASVYDESVDTITSIFDVFKSCDYPAIWIGNQELESSFSSIVKTNTKVALIDSLRSVLSFNKVLDQELLMPITTHFSQKDKGLFTVHMMGSHWWYENRYDDAHRKFTPVIDSKHVPSLSSEELINSYDNTIVYLDFFLEEIIKQLESEDSPTILIYLSDHGEALGEEGKWLHGQDTEASKNPAMVVWYSNGFREEFPEKIKALMENKNKKLTTDILYHSLLDLIEVNKFGYNKSQSIFSLSSSKN